MAEAGTSAKKQAVSYVNILPGDTAPWFAQRSTSNPRYVFDTAAGRYLVLCFLGSGSDDHVGRINVAVGGRDTQHTVSCGADAGVLGFEQDGG